MADTLETRSAELDENASLDATLARAIDNLPDGVLLLDEQWRIIYANQSARRLSRIQPENLNRETLWELHPEIIGTALEQAYHDVVATRTERALDSFYYEPAKAWFDVRIMPAERGLQMHYRDVTERRQKEDSLRESEQRYRVLTELNPQALWTADSEGRVLYANQRFLDYIGQDQPPRNGAEYLQCFFEPDRGRVERLWAHSVATGEEYVVDARVVRADGVVRWWHLRALPVRDEAGVFQQWLGTAIDVHDSRMAAERLREQYALVESSRDFIGICDLQGCPVYGNRAALQLVGIDSLADFTRVHMREFFFPEDQRFIIDEFFPKVLLEGHGEVEIRFRHFKTGEALWMAYHVFLLRDFSGEPVGFATVSRDITAQKRAETALIQSEKLAAVGRLASSIAHEINNPLESVTNLLYLAREHGGLPEQVQHFLDTADLELRRVSIIANQTLRFHKQSTKAQAIGCADLFSTVLSIYEGRLKNSKITVEKRKRATRPVVCFEGEIRQVLSNLVGNADDAMPNGGRLLVRSREATDWQTGRSGLVLTVADTGGGIDRQTQARMFEPFFTTKGFGGTGLGLWISTQIIERHQGRIRIRSSQHQNHHGTVVTIFLPFQTTPTPGALPS